MAAVAWRRPSHRVFKTLTSQVNTKRRHLAAGDCGRHRTDSLQDTLLRAQALGKRTGEGARGRGKGLRWDGGRGRGTEQRCQGNSQEDHCTVYNM